MGGGHTAGQFAPRGRKTVAGAMLHKKTQGFQNDPGLAPLVFARQLGRDSAVDSGVNLRSGETQLFGQCGICRRRLALLYGETQKHHQILRTKSNLGI